MSQQPIVLLIHGMGTHTDASVKEEFKVGLAQCMAFLGEENYDISQHVDLKTFNYSEYWDQKRKAFANHLEGDIKEALALTPSLIQKIHGLIGEFDGDEFLYTHVLDVLFYLTGALRADQLVDLHKALSEMIKESINHLDGQRLIVVAHSLGTAFIHDCLTQLYPNRLNPQNFGLDQLWSVATVSRLTHMITRMANPMTSNVIDHTSTVPGVCKQFFPVYNDFDPFCWFMRYTRTPNEGMLINTKHVRDLHAVYGDSTGMRVNPHDLREYFADPEVGARFLFSNHLINIDMKKFDAAKAKYQATTATGLISNTADEIKAKLRALGESAGGVNGMRKKVEILTDVYKLIDEMRDEFKF